MLESSSSKRLAADGDKTCESPDVSSSLSIVLSPSLLLHCRCTCSTCCTIVDGPCLFFLFEVPLVPSECCVAKSNDFTQTARSASFTHSQENFKKKAAGVSCRMARQMAHLIHILRTLADVRWAQLRPSIFFLLEARESSSHANLFKSEMMVPKKVLLEAKKKTAPLALLLGTLEPRQGKGGLAKTSLAMIPTWCQACQEWRRSRLLRFFTGPCLGAARASGVHELDPLLQCRVCCFPSAPAPSRQGPRSHACELPLCLGGRLDEANRVVPAFFNLSPGPQPSGSTIGIGQNCASKPHVQR